MIWQIQATIEIHYSDGSIGTRQLPTFFLNGDIQGIVSKDHAHNIAMEIINAGQWDRLGKCHLTVETMAK